MTRNLMALPGLLALVLACGQGRTDGQNAGASGSESGALPADTGYVGGAGIDDTTAAPSVGADTATMGDTSAASTDTGTAGNDSPANQDQSGVTNTETGQSELGDGVTKTSPDQGEPVTSKGDTVGMGGEATGDTAH